MAHRINHSILSAVMTALLWLGGAPALAAELPAPTGLLCNLLADPAKTVIFDAHPRFSWIVNAPGVDQIQSAYEISIASSTTDLKHETPYLWSSGKVISEQSIAVVFVGKPLTADREYTWKVRTWTGDKQSEWSIPQTFRLGEIERGGKEDRFTVSREPLAQTLVVPKQFVEVGEGHYFIDFGRAAYAALKLKIDSPQAGTKIIVHLGEALSKPSVVNRKPGGSIRYQRVEMELKEGMREYTVPLDARDARRMPPEIGAAMPFRYVEIENAPTMDAASVRQIAVHYPFDESAAKFESSDKTLNDVWELCRYSIKATSFCGLYVDGDRERLPYEADAYINQLGHYCVDREYTLARYSHEFLIQHATWPTEWPMHSVFIAWSDYLYTGDTASLLAFYDDLKAKTLFRLERADGLISTTQPKVSKEILDSLHESRLADIVDWPMSERDKFEMKPVNAVVNAFHYRAMRLMANLADAAGKPVDAEFFKRGADKVAVSFNRVFFDEQTGLYVDGEGSRHSSLHANMCALAFNLVSKEDQPKVAAFVRGKGMACSVYGSQYLMEALYRSGQADHALSLLTSRGERSWAHMLYDVGSTITLEAWDNKFKPNQDWNHAWGAAPANVIPRLLMGVEPIKPGFRNLRIKPQPGGLKWAALDLPTIRGTVHVDFKSSPKQFDLNVTLPANTTAEVWMPRLGTEDVNVMIDGVRKPLDRVGDFLILKSLGSGPHRIVREIP